MFDNVGEKIQKIAKIIYYLGVVGSVVVGFIAFVCACLTEDDTIIFLGLLAAGVIIGVGILMSYLSVIVLYAFGDLVENTYIIANNSAISASNSEKAKFALEQNSLQQKRRPTCRVCYHVNPEEAEICQKCGEKL